jgi:S1-C subfamily serine protease
VSGCGSTDQIFLSDSLSSDIQLRINTAEEFNTDFNFSPHPEGDRIVVESGASNSKAAYSINEPMKGRLEQLIRTKFGSVNESSENKILVSINRVEANNVVDRPLGSGKHVISMEIGVEIQRDGEIYKREIERESEIEIEVVDKLGRPINLDEDQISEFMNQFVVGVNSFIDSNFGVD